MKTASEKECIDFALQSGSIASFEPGFFLLTFANVLMGSPTDNPLNLGYVT